MAVLPKILKDYNIKSMKDFKQYIKGNQEEALRVIRDDGSEGGFPGSVADGGTIELSGLIVDVVQLSLFPKEGLVLRNCIFTGKININGRNFDGSSNIEIENCIFLEELIITGFSGMQKRNLSIFHTNAAYLSMFNIKASGVIITGCRVFFMSIHEIASSIFEAENNCFRHFEIEGCRFSKVAFDHRQVDIDSIGKRIVKGLGEFRFKEYSQLNMNMNLFVFMPYKTSEDIKRSQTYNTVLETVDFYKNSTSLGFDRNKYMKLMFYEVLLAQNKPLHKAFVWITGGFLKPYRFIVIAIIMLMLFSGIYMLPMLEFYNGSEGIARALSLGRALYFSGITFTTIGYGDISPLGVSRLFAILEGIFGISIMSCFLVALVKKYID